VLDVLHQGWLAPNARLQEGFELSFLDELWNLVQETVGGWASDFDWAGPDKQLKTRKESSQVNVFSKIDRLQRTYSKGLAHVFINSNCPK